VGFVLSGGPSGREPAPAARLNCRGRHRPIRRGGRGQPSWAKPAVGDGDDDQDDEEPEPVASSTSEATSGRRRRSMAGSVPSAWVRSKVFDEHVDQLRHGHRSPIVTDRPPGPHHWPMAPVDIPEPFIEPPSVDVGQPDAQGKPLVTQPAGGILTRVDQGRADAAPLQRPHDLQVMELRDAGKVLANLRHVGWLPQQIRITHGTVTQPGDEQHATPLLLAGQAVSEEWPLPERFHQGGKLGSSARPDLQLRTHRAQPDQLVAPVHRVSPRGKPQASHIAGPETLHMMILPQRSYLSHL
jgi:hypothetical protein